MVRLSPAVLPNVGKQFFDPVYGGYFNDSVNQQVLA